MSESQEYPGFNYGPGYQHTTHDWMSNNPVIEALTLGELILPGAHNSGADKKASYVIHEVTHWAACQNNSFLAQLNNGARALDLRIEQDKRSNFWFQHNNFRSSRTLEELIMAVDRFLIANPDEFIVLDFHEMRSSDAPFNEVEFTRMMMTHLGSRIIPTANSQLTLGQLKQASAVQRVMVATEVATHFDYFNPRIWHEWSGSNLTDTDQLHRFIAKVMQSPPWGDLPWSLSATSYSIHWGPTDIKEQLNQWFDPALSDWVSKCSIINADFFEESRLVLHCREANVTKARAKLNAAASTDPIPK